MPNRRLLFGLSIVVTVLSFVPSRSASPAVSAGDPARTLEAGGAAPGRVLVKFQRGTSDAEITARVRAHGGRVVKAARQAGLVVIGVPVGQEKTAVARLRTEPRVEYAAQDWRLAEGPGAGDGRPEPLLLPGASLEQVARAGKAGDHGGSPVLKDDAAAAAPSVRAAPPCPPVAAPESAGAAAAVAESPIGNLRMATVADGLAPFESQFNAGLSEIFAVFDYTMTLEATPVRLALTYADPVSGTLDVFQTTQVYTGTGSASLGILASLVFPDDGAFRPGFYQTILSTSSDGGHAWDPVSSFSWRMDIMPNDEYFGKFQWNLNNSGQKTDWSTPGVDIDAPEGWDVTTGRNDLVIAFVGSGVDLTHPDLRDRIWTNPAEIPGNGIDDDGNGYVDDTHGWDFVNGDSDPTDDFWTGTFAAGLAAATTDNQRGIAGVTWGGRIMPLKVVDSDGHGYSSDVVEAMLYAADNGARIIHLSPQYTADNFDVVEALRQTIEYVDQRGILVVVGAGDRGRTGNPVVYPAAFERVLSVAATDGQDQRLPWSSTGYWVDVAAASQYIISTFIGGGYRNTIPSAEGGSTFSAAQVAGLAALVWSVNPALTPGEVKSIIERSADDLGPPGRDDSFGWGRINVARALHMTPHQLVVSPSSLTFVCSEEAPEELCKTVTNPNTSALTWRAGMGLDDWLTIAGPTGRTPSSVQVCVRCAGVPNPVVYLTTITATSTLTATAGGPVSVPVRILSSDQGYRLYLPVIRRAAVEQ